ncbi:MAG: bacterioferritin [Candidatus Brocadiaceae bacterium]|nr:bacterioferritin [Candidatus Brocadiaceae bacterium]
MEGNPKVLEALNDVLRAELTAINQYFLHAKMTENWGYKRLYDFNEKNSIEEMKHAEIIMERMLYLDGRPEMGADKLNIGKTVQQQIENDFALEKEAIPRLQKAIKLCAEVGDAGTKNLFEGILKDEEKHASDLEEHLQLIKDMGIENYLGLQVDKGNNP